MELDHAAPRIPKTAETESLRMHLHRLLTAAALAAWEGDIEAAAVHVKTARLLAASERPR